MATVLDPASLTCEFSDGRRAVAFSRWEWPDGFRGSWRLFCRQHVKHLADDPTAQLVYLPGHDPDPAAEPDHPGHVHIRYAGGTIHHPTNI